MKKEHRMMRRRPLFTPLIMPVLAFIVVALALAWFFDSRSTTSIIVVRHAEKAAEPADDPGLNEAGRVRADELARLLSLAEIHHAPDYVFVSEYRRSMETVEPLIRRSNPPVNEYRARDSAALVDELLSNYRGKTVLVVAHSNTVGEIVDLLGSRVDIPEMTESEYDDMYLVSIPRFGKVQVLRFKYGASTETIAESN